MNHENDAGPKEANATDGRPPRRKRVDSLPAPRPNSFPAALGAPSPKVESPTEVSPAAEVSVTPRSVFVTVELPGAPKDALDIQATDLTLRIVAPRVGGPGYRLDIDLPARVDPRSARATYRNGILDVTLERRDVSGGEGDEA